MLSVLIETRNDEERLARTLAALIAAAVEGVVRDVIVCDQGSTDQTKRVAEHAGCQFIAEGGLAAGIRHAKGEWLLLLEPGARPVEGWTEAVLDHVATRSVPARFRPSRDERPTILSRLFSARRALAGGLLVKREQALPLALADAETLARNLQLTRLPALIRAAGRKG